MDPATLIIVFIPLSIKTFLLPLLVVEKMQKPEPPAPRRARVVVV